MTDLITENLSNLRVDCDSDRDREIYHSFEEYRSLYPRSNRCRLIYSFQKDDYIFYQTGPHDAMLVQIGDYDIHEVRVVATVLLFPELSTAVIASITSKCRSLATTYMKVSGMRDYKRKKAGHLNTNLTDVLRIFLGRQFEHIYVGFRPCLQRRLRQRMVQHLKKSLDATIIPRDCYTNIALNVNRWLSSNSKNLSKSTATRADFEWAEKIHHQALRTMYNKPYRAISFEA